MKLVSILIASFILFAEGAAAQNLRSMTGNSLPVNCTAGDEFTKADAATGQKKFICIATDTWEQQGGSGSSHGLLSGTHTDTTAASPVRGDIVTAQGVSPVWSRLSKGSQYQTLQAGASEPSYDAVHLDQATAVDGTLAETHGGTNQSSYALGDLLYSSAANTLAKLAGNTTATKKFLTQTGTGVVSAAPGWNSIAAGDIPDLSGTYQATSTKNAANGYAGLDAGTKLSAGQLPNPSASTLGGIKSYAAAPHQWLNSISTGGAPASSQPACADLSNAAASCSTDTTNASNISSGTLPTARLPSSVPKVQNIALSTAEITGDSADHVLATYSLPGNTLSSTGCARVTWVLRHSTGTLGVTSKTWWNATINGSSQVTSGTNLHNQTTTNSNQTFGMLVCNNGATSSQIVMPLQSITNTNVVNATAVTAAVDTTAAVNITFSFNAANTEKVIPYAMLVEILNP